MTLSPGTALIVAALVPLLAVVVAMSHQVAMLLVLVVMANALEAVVTTPFVLLAERCGSGSRRCTAVAKTQWAWCRLHPALVGGGGSGGGVLCRVVRRRAAGPAFVGVTTVGTTAVALTVERWRGGVSAVRVTVVVVTSLGALSLTLRPETVQAVVVVVSLLAVEVTMAPRVAMLPVSVVLATTLMKTRSARGRVHGRVLSCLLLAGSCGGGSRMRPPLAMR